ncbi:MAG: hypothetical protein ABII80_01085 [bacterium]
MKRFLVILILAAIAYGGYQYYLQYSLDNNVTPPQLKISDKLDIRQSNLSDFTDVLGAATSNLLESGKDLLDNITDKDGEPIINKTVDNLTNQIKDLPKEQYDKVKYEFCKDVVVKYESPAPTN